MRFTSVRAMQQHHRQMIIDRTSSRNSGYSSATSSSSSRRRRQWTLMAISIGALSLCCRYGSSLMVLSRALEIERGLRRRTNTSTPSFMESASSVVSDTNKSSSTSNHNSSTNPNHHQVDICHVPESTNSIRSYMSLMAKPEDWVVLKWNADGSFDHSRAQALTYYAHWAPPPDVLGDTEPSAHGRVVLLLNSDRLPLVPWMVRPHIPIWAYSKPIAAFDPRSSPETLPDRCEVDWVTLVPNPYDRMDWNRYCVEQVELKVQRRTFAEKINKIVWRGAIHFGPVERSRVALLELGQAQANETSDWLDVKEINQTEDPGHMEHYELAEYRYHLDLGGLSGTSWGGLRWKMCAGLLVFKVESWANDMWHDTLEPWTHYIPVQTDVSDLHDRYLWTQNNPERAQEIAEAGKKRCLETFGPDKAKEQYQAAVQQIPAAMASDILEAEEILDQMMTLKTDMRGILTVTEQ